MTATPYLPSQLRDLANEQTEDEGGMRDSDWMAEAVIALRDAASQIEHLTWVDHLVPDEPSPPTREPIAAATGRKGADG